MARARLSRPPQGLAERSWPWITAAAGWFAVISLMAYLGPDSIAFLTVLGIAVVLFLLASFAYTLRKRPLQERLGGTMMAWFKAHVYLGAATLGVGVVHGVKAEGNLAGIFGLTSGKIAFVLLLLIAISGLTWRIVYFTTPPKVADAVGNLSISDTTQRIEELEVELDKVKVGRHPLLQRAADDLVAGRRSLHEIEYGLGRLEGPDAHAWQRIKEIATRLENETARKKRQRNFSDVLQGWRAIHIPLAALLVVAVLYHVYDVYIVRG